MARETYDTRYSRFGDGLGFRASKRVLHDFFEESDKLFSAGTIRVLQGHYQGTVKAQGSATN